MKIQLKGMMRRRGQTRSEQKAIKKIEIENAQWRIEQLQGTVDYEESIESGHLDELKLQYDDAKAILDEYKDRAKHNLDLLKDIRDDEIRDMNESYDAKRKLLKKYTSWEAEENAAMINENEIYVSLLDEIAGRPETAEMYKELYGINASEEAILALARLRTFQQSQEMTAPPKAGSGGGGTKQYHVKSSRRSGNKLTVSSSSGQKRVFSYSNPASALVSQTMNYRVRQRLSWKRGTYDVPEDMVANLHKHEKVVPAGDSTKAGGNGDVIIQNLTIDVREIADIGSVEKVGAILSAAQNSRVLTRSGKTKFRSR